MNGHARRKEKRHALSSVKPDLTRCGEAASAVYLADGTPSKPVTCGNCLRAEGAENRRRLAMTTPVAP